MKQTVSILMALTAVVLVATGLIVADNMDLNQRITQQETELIAAHEKVQESQKQLREGLAKLEAAAEALDKTMAERDALNQQLQEAALASQTAHETAREQRALNEKARLELETLKTEYLDLADVCAVLEAQISALNDQAVQSAAAYEQQTLWDAQRIAQLERQLAVTPSPVPTPAPTAFRQPSRFEEY